MFGKRYTFISLGENWAKLETGSLCERRLTSLPVGFGAHVMGRVVFVHVVFVRVVLVLVWGFFNNWSVNTRSIFSLILWSFSIRAKYSCVNVACLLLLVIELYGLSNLLVFKPLLHLIRIHFFLVLGLFLTLQQIFTFHFLAHEFANKDGHKWIIIFLALKTLCTNHCLSLWHSSSFQPGFYLLYSREPNTTF